MVIAFVCGLGNKSLGADWVVHLCLNMYVTREVHSIILLQPLQVKGDVRGQWQKNKHLDSLLICPLGRLCFPWVFLSRYTRKQNCSFLEVSWYYRYLRIHQLWQQELARGVLIFLPPLDEVVSKHPSEWVHYWELLQSTHNITMNHSLLFVVQWPFCFLCPLLFDQAPSESSLLWTHHYT